MKKPKKLKILLTGGGTGGHIYPLVAVARELNNLSVEKGFNADIRYFGDPGNFRNYLESNDIRISKIASSKWRRYFSIQNFFDIFRFFFGWIQSIWKLYWFMPHACFSKGGPGALSVILASRFYFIPIVIHESDAIPGLTNKISSKRARLVEVAFKKASQYFQSKKTEIHVVGNPVRAEVLKVETAPIVKGEFGFDPNSPVILFLGGSQGAEALNNFVFKHIERITKKFQVLHQVGPNNFEDYKANFDFLYGKNETLKLKYNFRSYFEHNINKAYEAADLVISRAGAGLIFEIAAAGKPSILVPLPESANDHQVHNAYEYSRTGATTVIEEENLLTGVLLDEIDRILNNEELRKKMSEAARAFYVPDSAKIIAGDIFTLVLRV